MAKKRNAIVRIDPLKNIPVHLQDVEETGVENLGQYMVPPRIKVIQRQSDETLLDLFNVGDVILSPSNQRVSEMEIDTKGRPTGESDGFLFIPLFFFAEWCVWNPIEMKGKAPAIRQRSLDPTSDIAQRSKNPATRIAPHPTDDNMQIRYVEHLNFIVAIPDVEGNPILSFSRGTHAKGSAFCALIKQRKAPLYGCVFEAHLVLLQNDMGSWWSIEVANPSGKTSPWVNDEKQFEAYQKLFNEFKQLHADALITPSYEESDEGSTVTPEENENF